MMQNKWQEHHEEGQGLVEEIRGQLLDLAEPDYRDFSAALLPGISEILGVRLPALRKLAKKLAKGPWEQYLEQLTPVYFEERMLWGMLLGEIKVPPEERLARIAAFVPYIHCWSVCDSFCAGLKFTKEHQQLVWDFLQPYLNASGEYECRFAIIMLMDYYLGEEWLDAVLIRLDAIQHEGYYVKMAVAWALSMAYLRDRDKLLAYFQNNHLDEFTYQKALQKTIESRRVTNEEKTALRQMKRKG